jgi:hypothetical protein
MIGGQWRLPCPGGDGFPGKKAVGEHLDWLEKLQCGWGLIDQESYRVPTMSV